MHRCYIHPDDWNDSMMSPADSEEHHLMKVLRLSAGDTVALFDGRGRELFAKIVMVAGVVNFEVISDSQTVTSRPMITLIQALPKGRRMDLIVEKATELGVSCIRPVTTNRTIVDLDARKREKRRERWQRIALSAARQCGVNWVPDVLPVSSFGDALRHCESLDLLLVGSLSSDALSFRKVMKEMELPGVSLPSTVGLIIGPEGDLDSDELRAAVDAGAVEVSFGSLVLRVETAALYGISVLAYELMDSL